ncbi:phosphotransferase [Diaporthe helianthi]|uniref:Phosphotransferase n=1 Tax=Diaporthe helianthi TaxID=158607 RepID=A0A2P5HM04_DIAHE|nr:phosphotransferase [Diaporthe helianthi]
MPAEDIPVLDHKDDASDDEFERDRQSFDMLAWDRLDDHWDDTVSWLQYVSTLDMIATAVAKKAGVPKTSVDVLGRGSVGSFNAVYPLRMEGESPNLLVRIPIPHVTQLPDERYAAEAGTLRFIRQNTPMRTPNILYHGSQCENPDVGPFMVIERIQNKWTLSEAFTRPRDPNDPDDPFMLDMNLPKERLLKVYRQLAPLMMQLLQHRFPRIGSLTQSATGSFEIRTRPVTTNMQGMLAIANIPLSALPAKNETYDTADAWYVACCDMIWAPLLLQRNDFVTSADDCRNKYVARQIIRRLATEGKLATFGFEDDTWSEQSKKMKADREPLCPAPAGSGEAAFPLWCDDFQTGNMLVDDDDNVTGVIDWEFTYAAPAQFCLDPPWWLLIEMPEVWILGLENFSSRFSETLPVWLEAVEEVEKGVDLEVHHLSQPWSVYMRQSWETGRFWLNYAIRKGWAFDSIYWKFLDERFFGERPKDIAKEKYWRSRIDLLTEKERAGLEPFVEKKMKESEERILVDNWDDDEVRRRFADVMLND